MVRIAFCQRMYFEYLGIMQMSAQLKREGHYVEVFINRLGELFRRIRNRDFDLVCFSISTYDVHWSLSAAAQIKAIDRAIPIVAGGPHPTYFPEFIANRDIDIICIGEGDRAVCELAQAVENRTGYGEINNLCLKDGEDNVIRNPLNPRIENLDELPFADRSIYDRHRYFRNNPTTAIVASRGCPYRCSFCFQAQYNELYRTTEFKFRSPANVIDEIKAIQRRGKKIRLVNFVDSTFNLDQDWCLELFERYASELNVDFTVNIAAGLVTEKLVSAIAAKGLCHSVRLGIESGNEDIRKRVLSKNISNRQILDTARLLKKYRIPFQANILFGLPFETEKDAMETVRFTREVKPNFVFSGMLVPFRGLAVTKTAIESGALSEAALDEFACRSIKKNESLLKLKDIGVISNICSLSLLMIYFPALEPLLRRLLRWRRNSVFDLVYMASYFLEAKRYIRLGWAKSLLEGFYHRADI